MCNKAIKSSILRKKKNLSFEIETKLFSPSSKFDDDDLISSIQDLNNFLIEQDADLTQEQIDEIRSILEGAKALSKPTQRKSIVEDKSNKLRHIIIYIRN